VLSTIDIDPLSLHDALPILKCSVQKTFWYPSWLNHNTSVYTMANSTNSTTRTPRIISVSSSAPGRRDPAPVGRDLSSSPEPPLPDEKPNPRFDPPESSEPPEGSSGRPKMPPNPCPKLTVVPYLRAMPDSFNYKVVKFYRNASSRTGGVIYFTCWRIQNF